ncbi:galactose-specific lectin nattectin-like [Gambusia affinis]|uniref:galactose-specific lectin nattectin-like n=1 Tax=Gambusia affinis TaxID=33528 RepID=UPI001CDCE68D|nr:galactose-specific lectin nattectin-like [Gambusia affinis]
MAAGLVFTLLLGLSFGLWDGADAECHLRVPTRIDCPAGWSFDGDRCFIVFNIPKSWIAAEKSCLLLGAHLASFRTTEEYLIITHLIRKKFKYDVSTWVGAFDAVKEGRWMWSDGTGLCTRVWSLNQPKNDGGNEHCMVVNLDGKEHVSDVECHQKLPYVCAKPL